MLHAFNQKNARRVLPRGGGEHTIEKTEDAVTSMVFSPLSYMTAAEALRAFMAIVPGVAEAVRGREPEAHEMEFWPAGLRAPGGDGGTLTRCEPDLVAEFRFADGEKVVIVGELKWDWDISTSALEAELERERFAVRRHHAIDEPLMFVVAKRRRSPLVAGVVVNTWEDVLARLVPLARSRLSSPARRWAEQVRTFLEKADLQAFGGFPVGTEDMMTTWQRGYAFLREAL